MSSQDTGGIPLSHGPDTAGYKLLELPPELLELLESPDAPTLALHPSPTAALLKTPLKTYSLRQKNTSNALILLTPQTQPEPPVPANGDDGSVMTMPAAVGLAAIATVHETVELVPEAEGAGVGVGGTDAAGAGNAAAAPKPKGKWHERFGRGR